MANKNFKGSQKVPNKAAKKLESKNDFSIAFWASVRKYRFTAITIFLILIYFFLRYAVGVFG